MIPCNGELMPLCGLHLWESHARWLELDYLLHVTRDENIVAKVDSQLSQDAKYTAAFTMFAQTCRGRTGAEFPFVVALDTEVVPVPRDETEYQLFHPGYRFERILVVLCDTSVLNLDTTDLASEGRRFLRELAEAAGLRDPFQTASEESPMWRRDKKERESNQGVAADHDLLRAEALHVRMQTPWFFSIPH